MNELIEKRNNLWGDAKKFAEEHKTKDGTLSAEDYKTYEQMEKQIQDYTNEIERLKREKEMEDMMSKPTSEPITTNPANTQKQNPDNYSNQANAPSFRATKEYKNAMLKALRTNFRQLSNVLQEGVDASGGYLVPEEYDERLIQKLEKENIIRKLATKITTSGEHRINIAATKPAALWVEEGGALTFGEAAFEQISLDAHKLHVAVKVTDELLYDNAFNLQDHLINQFASALANAEEDAFLNGDGNKKPTGIFNETGGGEVGITSASEKLTADEIINLIYSLNRPYRKNAKFIMHDSSLSVIRKLKDNNGAYMWQPSTQAGEPDKLMGYDILTSPYAPQIEKGKSAIAFGDFSYYNIGDRGVRAFQELKELFADNGMVGFVMKERVDGKLILKEAVKLLKVGGTV